MSSRAVRSPVLVNAATMAATHPDTFGRPTAQELAALGFGSHVKVAVQGERFWVQFVRRGAGHVLIGRVDSIPLIAPLRHGDLIAFTMDNIYQVHTAAPVKNFVS